MTRKSGQHLTYEERCQIFAFLKSGNSKRSIAKHLNVHHTTIIREVRRNSGKRGYRYKQAERLAIERRHKASAKPYRLTPMLIEKALAMLKENQASPQQISGRLKKQGFLISHESLYQFIWRDKKSGGTLYKNLRHKGKKYNKRGAKKAGRGLIPNRIDIDERPKVVEKKQRFGDFELDTIVGQNRQGALVSIVDRATKYTFLRLVDRAQAENVKDAVCESLGLLSKNDLVHTLTSDNGKEFSQHEIIAATLGGDFYFAKPYHSWERGLNEHTNGLVRQYFPKGSDFTILTESQVRDVENKLNNRPRAVLEFETPKERLFKLCTNLPHGAFHH